MLELRLLGPPELRDTRGKALPTVLAQPKRFALLAFLAAARPLGFHRRDSLLALFWPELDGHHARGALSSAVYFLRGSMGREVVVSRGDSIAVDPRRLRCDAVSFRRAVSEGRRREALKAFRGDLLPGFFVTGAPEFERWLDLEREALRREASGASWSLAEELEAAGDRTGARRWGERALRLLPYDESGLRRQLALLVRLDDQAAAVRTFNAFRGRLRRDLGVDPSPATCAMVAAIRTSRSPEAPPPDPPTAGVVRTSSGGRRSASAEPVVAVGPFRAIGPGGDGEWLAKGLTEESTAVRPVKVGRRTGRALNAAAIAVLGLAVAVLAWRQLEHPRSAEGPASAVSVARSVAVLPFENLSADSASAYFASGMQNLILTKLAELGSLKVISRTSTEQYGSRPQNLGAIGRQLGVGAILEGSVQRAGKQVLINVQLVDTRTDGHLWADDYTRTLDNVIGVESEVAQKVSDALRATLTPADRKRMAAAPTRDPVAYDLYLQADAHANRAYDNGRYGPELGRAIPLYKEALARDSTFALASSALAAAQMYLYWFGPDRTDARLAAAKQAADRSLALQPELGEGHLALALYYYWGHRDYDRALQQVELARKALPNSVGVEEILAAIARRKGEWAMALASFRRATVLDPRRHDIFTELGITYATLRRYTEADSVFAHAVSLPGGEANTPARVTNAVLWKGDLAPLRAFLSKVGPSGDYQDAYLLDWYSRDFPAAILAAGSAPASEWLENNVALPRRLYLAWAYQAAGEEARAREAYAAVRSRMESALELRPDDPDPRLALAFADAGLGRKEEAVREGRDAARRLPPSRDMLTGMDYRAWLARLYVGVGENQRAIALLRELLKLPAGTLVSTALLRLDPVWDPIRRDPGFQELVRSAPATEWSPR
jgi:TolB-like protein/Tfp pilus assembly protein PilF